MATEALVTPNAATPSELLRIAVSSGAGVEQLEKLMDLQERWERNEARKAFVVAMNAFKVNPPEILKNKHVQAGAAQYDHATLDHVCRAVIQSLSKQGISHRWKMEQSDLWIKVTCVLTHDLGHSEETTLQGLPDQTGSKNSIQAIGSTVTYLQRYTLLGACGLAAGNDTDGRVNGNGKASFVPLPSDRVAEQTEWIANACDREELKKLFRNAYVEAETAKDVNAKTAFIKAYEARKKEL